MYINELDVIFFHIYKIHMIEGMENPLILVRFEQLRKDPKIVALREKMRKGEIVAACCDHHKDNMEARLYMRERYRK